MMNILVFCVVVGSTLTQIECSAKNLSTTLEKGRQDPEVPTKFHVKGHKIRHVKPENLTSSFYNNGKKILDSGKVADESIIADAASFITNTPKLPYPVVTMDAKSLNKTAALIEMVIQAGISNGGKLPKPSQAQPSQVNSPAKRHPSKEKVLDVLRRLNSVVYNYQPIYLMGRPKENLRKNERRYVITNFDVIESYIKSRRKEKKTSLEDNIKWPKRRSDNAEAYRSFDASSNDNGSDKQATEKDNGAAKSEDKLDYNDKSDDYIISTKRNVWNYEHEDWADVQTVNWDDVHSSKESKRESSTEKIADGRLTITIEEFVKPTIQKDAAVMKNDWEDNKSVIKVATTTKYKSESKTLISNIREVSKAVTKKARHLKELQNKIDQGISISKNYNSKETENSDKIKIKLIIDNQGKGSKGIAKENVDLDSEARLYRADRSNKPPNLNKADNWPKKAKKMDELNEHKVKKISSDETYNTPNIRGKLINNGYSDKKSEEKSGLSDRPQNQRINKYSKEIKNNNDAYFKKRTNDKDNADQVQEKTAQKEPVYDDNKDNYDYHDENKKSKGNNNDKKLDQNDYKDTKKRTSDYNDYYGGNNKEDKKVSKDQDHSDKKFRNDYKNTDDMDYKDDYGKNKKQDKDGDYTDKNIRDDYKYKNTDYNINDDKKNRNKEKKKNNYWTGKRNDNWSEERSNRMTENDDLKSKKAKSTYKKNKMNGKDKVDDWDDQANSREIESAKSNKKEYKKTKKEELDYQDSEDKNLNKNKPFDMHANNDWDNVGTQHKNNDKIEITTRRTTKKFIEDYDKPIRKPKDYLDDIETTKYRFDPTAKNSYSHANNNWDYVAVTKRKHYEIDSYIERPRGKKKKTGRGGGGYNSYSHTSLPMRERKSVFEDD